MTPGAQRGFAKQPWLVVGAAEGDFALPVARVLEILPSSALRAPEAKEGAAKPDAVCGVVDARGRAVPVLDLVRRLRLPAGEAPRQRVLLTEARHRTFGIRVDRVEDLLEVAPAKVQAVPAFLRRPGNEHLVGMVLTGKGWLILLDVDHLLRLDAPTVPRPLS